AEGMITRRVEVASACRFRPRFHQRRNCVKNPKSHARGSWWDLESGNLLPPTDTQASHSRARKNRMSLHFEVYGYGAYGTEFGFYFTKLLANSRGSRPRINASLRGFLVVLKE